MSSDRETALPPLLRACWIKLNSTFQKRLSELKITPDQYIVLRWLTERTSNSTSQSVLARLMFTDANNISALIKRMENHGLLNRYTSENDKRVKILRITERGKNKFKLGKEIATNLENQSLSGLSEKEKIEFNFLLGKLNELLNTN